MGRWVRGGARAGDKDMALRIYQQCNASGKIIGTLAEKGDFNALVAYTGQTGQKLDYLYLLQVRLCTPLARRSPTSASTNDCGGALGTVLVRRRRDACAPLIVRVACCVAQSLMMNNPQGAVALAKMVVKQTPPPVDVNTVADLFLQRNMIREATAFLLDALSGDKPEQATLQTKLLEINLITNPQASRASLVGRRRAHFAGGGTGRGAHSSSGARPGGCPGGCPWE